ncbi:MAG: hypothetical protein NVS3B21_30230 [Acidimicrobiales bacterium]
MRHLRQVRFGVALTVITLASSGSLGAAWGSFSSAPSAGASVATASVSAPVLAAPTCGLVSGIGPVTLTWAPTTSTFATGYQVLRSANNGAFVLLVTIAGKTTTSYIDNVAANLGTLSYELITVAAFSQTTWTSAASNTVACY